MKKVLFLLLAVITSYGSMTAQSRRDVAHPMPSRQVHLDFHTSELMPDVGSKFSKKQFQEALKTGHVNQINIFAKGCHSWCYYPTKIGKMHPNLKFDLMGAEIEACHEIGVKCPIYYVVGWSANDAIAHPEWRMRDKDGKYTTMDYDLDAKAGDSKPYTSWLFLCVAANGPYHRYVMNQIEEICKSYPVDGFWFDIYHIKDVCYCDNCLKRMKEEGVDINDAHAVALSHARSYKEHMRQIRELVAKYHPEATVFFNSATHIKDSPLFTERLYDMNTHEELEDLPTAWGGYDKLPLEAKFHLQQNTPVVAMSGKFHKDWGEFGGYKHPDAIKYEAAAMISNGASCNFGDQLHPCGEMDMSTYRNIGKAYEYVEKIERYGLGGRPVSKLGVWLTLDGESNGGISNMLLELHEDFVVASEKNLQDISTLIIPSKSELSQSQADAITRWVSKGGNLLVLGEGAMNEGKTRFLLDLGVTYEGMSPYTVDYTVAGKDLAKDMVSSPFLNYTSALRVRLAGAKPLAYIREPYFNRTYGTYCSHRETPYRLENSEYPAITRYGHVIYIAHPLDCIYYKNGMRLHRQIFANALKLIYEDPMLKVSNLPSCGRVSLLKQDYEHRYVAHLLYGPAITRGDVSVVEDFVALHNVELEMNIPEKVKKIYRIPDNKPIEIKRSGNHIKIVIPEFTMHTGVVFEY